MMRFSPRAGWGPQGSELQGSETAGVRNCSGSACGTLAPSTVPGSSAGGFTVTCPLHPAGNGLRSEFRQWRRCTCTPGRDGWGDILKARTQWGGDGPGILVLSHIDTVHPIGMIEKALKFERKGDVVFGPGIYDMKGGAYLAYYAYQHLVRAGRQTPLPLSLIHISEPTRPY